MTLEKQRKKQTFADCIIGVQIYFYMSRVLHSIYFFTLMICVTLFFFTLHLTFSISVRYNSETNLRIYLKRWWAEKRQVNDVIVCDESSVESNKASYATHKIPFFFFLSTKRWSWKFLKNSPFETNSKRSTSLFHSDGVYSWVKRSNNRIYASSITRSETRRTFCNIDRISVFFTSTSAPAKTKI